MLYCCKIEHSENPSISPSQLVVLFCILSLSLFPIIILYDRAITSLPLCQGESCALRKYFIITVKNISDQFRERISG